MRFSILQSLLLACWIPGICMGQELAPDFSATEIGGNKTFQLSAYRGKIILLDFWASWCPPCLVSLPAYDKMYQELDNEEFEILAVNVDENTEDGIEFLEDHPISYVSLADPNGEIGIPYGIRSLPVSYLIDREGRIIERYRDFKIGDEIALKLKIEELLDR